MENPRVKTKKQNGNLIERDSYENDTQLQTSHGK
jgi:hypothetical protein